MNPKYNRCRRLRVVALLAALGIGVLSVAPAAKAADVTWGCVTGLFYWEDAFCWSPLGVPTGGDSVLVGPVSGNDTVVRFHDATGTRAASYLIVDSTSANSVGIVQTGGSLTVNVNEIIGEIGTGSFTQSGGTHSVYTLLMGPRTGSHGTFTLSGTGNLSADYEVIGDHGTGSFIQTGGTNSIGLDLVLGFGHGGVGSYQLSGTGSLSTHTAVIGNFFSTGHFIQSGGTHTVADSLFLGRFGGSSGVYDLSGGTLNVGKIVNGEGTGTFNLDGGTLNLGNSMDVDTFVIGSIAGTNGSFTLGSGKTLTVGTKVIGDRGGGSIVQDGGTHTVTGNLYVGRSNDRFGRGHGSYVLNGGSLSVGEVFIGDEGTGGFTQGGGTHTANSLILGFAQAGNGSYILSSGSLNSNSETIGNSGNGRFVQTDGTNAVNHSVIVGANSGSSGSYDLSGGRHRIGNRLILGNAIGGSGSYNLSGDGELSAFEEHIGNVGTGRFTHNGGTNRISNALHLGRSGGDGTYVLNGGSLSTSMAYVGHSGTGNFVQSGGTNAVGVNLFIGHGSGVTGSYHLTGIGSLSADVVLVGFSGIGSFIHSGGTNTVSSDLIFGAGAGSSGRYELSGGILNTEFETVGHAGNGRFTQSGGTHTVNNNLVLGQIAGSSGAYTLNGGTLTVGGLVKGAGNGTFDFNAGTLNFSNDLSLDSASPLGSNLVLTGVKALGVVGTTTLNGTSTLTLDGGTFSTGSLVNNGGFIFNRGKFNLTKDNLLIGAGGLLGNSVQLNSNQTVNVTNTTTINNGSVLALNNSAFSSGIIDNNGQVALGGVISHLGGDTLNNAGRLTGSGQVSAMLNNQRNGEVRVLAGESMVFTGTGNSNSGRIALVGGSLDFTQGLTNTADGMISGRGVVAAGTTEKRALINHGSIAVSGTSDFLGDVTNARNGAIVVSGGATATFHDDVVHNGAEIRVGHDSRAVFLGAVSGAGAYTGTGAVFFEGDLRPGNSPALISIAGDMTLGLLSHTTMELGGLLRGTEYDAFDVGGTLSLGGTLNVSFFDLGSGLFAPKAGDVFDLYTAELVQGTFGALSLAALLDPNLRWNLDYLTDFIGSTDVVRLSVVSAVPIPAAAWLLGSGLLGMVGVARRRRGRMTL